MSFLCLFASWCASAPAAGPSEYQVKAAFLLNFTKFVDWPDLPGAEPAGTFPVCIVGEDPFGPILDEMVRGERIDGAQIVVRRMRSKPEPACRVVFISNSEKNVPAILATVGKAVLTVGDNPEFVAAGGMIGFVLENHRVRFDINKGAANSAGLRFSSKLLSVARSVLNQ